MKEKQCYRPILVSDKGGRRRKRDVLRAHDFFIDKEASIR